MSLELSLRGKLAHLIHIRGENDATTAKLVSQFNDLPDRRFKNISYAYSSNDPLGILESVCLIECSDDQAVEYSQGTGFIVEGGAVVTNYHVVSYLNKEADNNAAAKLFPVIEVRFEGLDISYQMKVVHFDEKKDVAILRCIDEAWNNLFAQRACRLNFTAPMVGSAVHVVGYPNHTDGSTCQLHPGYVTGSRSVHGNRYFSVSSLIVKGNSGGPVIDQFGQVIGIATLGADAGDIANIAFNGCIPMHSIDRLILTGF